MATGLEGFKLGIAGFLVPFAFVYQPALLLDGSMTAIVFSLLTTAFGVVCLAAGVVGYLFHRLNKAQRILLLAAAGLLVFGQQLLTIGGLAGATAVFVWSLRDRATCRRAVLAA